jgi:HK97 family phage major capsid protein
MHVASHRDEDIVRPAPRCAEPGRNDLALRSPDRGVTKSDLLGYLAMQAGRALGNKFGTDLVNGTGSGQPNGLINLATVGVTGATTGVSGAPSYANLVDLEYSVIAPYRQSRSCYWLN